eukprot:11575155-Alexandrium_andersonii.AAC.1
MGVPAVMGAEGGGGSGSPGGVARAVAEVDSPLRAARPARDGSRESDVGTPDFRERLQRVVSATPPFPSLESQ